MLTRPIGLGVATPGADKNGAVSAESDALGQAELHEAVLEAQAKLGEGFAVLDIASQKVLHVNEALAGMVGYTRDELLALPSVFDLVPASAAKPIDASRRRRLAGSTAEPDTWETVLRRNDGSRLDVEIAITPVRSDDITHVVALVRDITARKASDRELRQSEARWRTVVGGAPVMIWSVDASGVFTMAEGRVLDRLKMTPEDLIGRSIEDVYARMPGIVEHYKRALRGEAVEATTVAAGRTLQASLVPSYDDQGRLDGVIGVATDITDLVSAESELTETQARYGVVLDALQEGVLMVDRLGRVLAANPAAKRILDPEGAPLVGNTMSDPRWQVLREDGNPLSLEEFPASITLATGEARSNEILCLYRPDGTHTWISVNTEGVFQEGEKLPRAVVISIADVTERRSFEAELRFLADHDALTGLPNRRRFHEELQRHLAFTARYGGQGAALLLDLDNFKYLNDTQGHKAGDQYLISLARVLTERLRQTDVVARLGGDEFGILLPAADPVQARRVAEALQQAVREHSPVLGGQLARLSTSIGIACFGDSGAAADPDQLLTAADLAMYEAKEGGRDRIGMATAQSVDERSMRARMKWLERIKRAIDEESFILYCQPIADVASGDVSQYELLLRLEDEGGRVIPATAFLSTAERFDLVQEIDRWVVRQAIDLIAAHSRAGRELKLEVNISAKSIGDPELPQVIETNLADAAIDPALLVLEITETTAIANMDEAVDFATRLSRLGCGFALDDFGRGFGSFYYLKHLPLNYLKIDGDFVRNLAHNVVDQQVVSAVVQVAKALGYKTIAEYVGDDVTVAALQHYGVDFMQGYHVGRPRALNPASSGFL
jgi:diguanylate cyclase (GGDEF)-like protein/PAS domain S-box-containing protein